MSFSIGQPNSDGTCATDVFKVSGADNYVPDICGDNAGQHSKFNSSNNYQGEIQFNNCLHLTFHSVLGRAYPLCWNEYDITSVQGDQSLVPVRRPVICFKDVEHQNFFVAVPLQISRY